MEFHQIRYFLAVARSGNFSRAARQCNISQPSLSQQILKLEEEFGEKLFHRLKRRAVLTAAGEAFAPRAERIVSEMDAARQDVADVCNAVRGRVTLGVLPTIAPYFLPQLLLGMSERYPEVEVILQEEPTSRLIELIAACEVDFVIASDMPSEPRFVTEKLFEEALLLAAPKTHRFARKKVIDIKELDSERFILMKEGHCLGDQTLSFCSGRDFTPKVVFRIAQLETIQALVAADAGVSLIPRMACAERFAVIYRPLACEQPKRSITVSWRKEQNHSRAARLFLELLRETQASERTE